MENKVDTFNVSQTQKNLYFQLNKLYKFKRETIEDTIKDIDFQLIEYETFEKEEDSKFHKLKMMKYDFIENLRIEKEKFEKNVFDLMNNLVVFEILEEELPQFD